MASAAAVAKGKEQGCGHECVERRGHKMYVMRCGH